MSMTRTVVAVALSALLFGCAQAPKPLYYWEGYQKQLYEQLKGTGSDDSLLAMEEQKRKADAAGLAVPPGFRAQRGLLLLHRGQPDQARDMFLAEKEAFPESSKYMDFLLKGLVEGKK